MRPLISCLSGLVLCLTAAGCQSEYSRTFRSSTGIPLPEPAAYRNMNLVAFAGTPRIVEADLSRQTQIHYLAEGWVPLGESSFYAPLESDDALRKQANKIGAELVLLSRTLGETVRDYNTYTTYEPVTIYRYGGRSTPRIDTAFVPQTNYVPYTENWYAQRAIYYTRRIQPPSFGALPRDLTADERKSLGSNAGVSVITAVQNTPAWNAGILPDDIIVNFAGAQVNDVDQLRSLIQQNAGKTVPVQYVRNGEKRSISVTLGPGNSGE